MLVYSLWLVYLRNHPESLGRYTDLYLITYIATDMKIERNSFKLGLCLDSIILCFPGLPLYSSNYPVDKDTHVCAKSLQSRPTLCDSLNRSPPGSCVHGILQARILGWVAMSSSRGSSWPKDGTCSSCTAGEFFTSEPLEKLKGQRHGWYERYQC